MTTKVPALFLDKDGTLTVDKYPNADPGQIELSPHSIEGLIAMRDAGYKLVVISNQPGVAFGQISLDTLKSIESRIRVLLAVQSIDLEAFYFCPHHPNGSIVTFRTLCTCRKPATGLFTRAAEDLGIDLKRSWYFGDILDDVEAGNRAGCRTVLINNGNETEWHLDTSLRWPHFVAPTIDHAVRRIQPELTPKSCEVSML